MPRQFSRTENGILRALSELDKIFLIWQVRVQCGTVPETFRSYDKINQEYNEECSQIGPYPEVGTSINRSHHSVILNPNQAL